MEEQLITFETAVLAKEKGFTFAYEFYDKQGKLEDFGMVGGYSNSHEFNYAAPPQSLLQKWLREVYYIHISIHPITNPDNSTKYYIYKSKKQLIDWNDRYDTYEEALEAALVGALKLIKL